jgi:hypothetical protein
MKKTRKKRSGSHHGMPGLFGWDSYGDAVVRLESLTPYPRATILTSARTPTSMDLP